MSVLIPKEVVTEDNDKTVLVALFGNSPEVRLMDFFLDHPLNDFMQKELAERTGMNKRTISRVLIKMLNLETVLVTRTIGKAVLYKLNHESTVVEGIRELEKKVSSFPAGLF